MNKFYASLADIFEVDEVKSDSVLRDFENWDSLTVLSITAMIDSDYGVTLNNADLRKMETVKELADFVTERKR